MMNNGAPYYVYFKFDYKEDLIFPPAWEIWKTWDIPFPTDNCCRDCPNNPRNGGSGICACTLATPKITC